MEMNDFDFVPDDMDLTAPEEINQIPHSREAEEAVLGAILINPEKYFDVSSSSTDVIFTSITTAGSGRLTALCLKRDSPLMFRRYVKSWSPRDIWVKSGGRSSSIT